MYRNPTKTTDTNYKAAIYCRLSKEDRYKDNESDDSRSITSQKMMLLDFVKAKNWELYDVYADDDFSGSNFDRPDFNRMLRDAKDHRFDVIICKDQSRFARDMLVVEEYINRLFPRWGIRFIGVSDGVDTVDNRNKKSRQIKSMVDEWYLEDTSDRIKSALHARMRKGLFVGALAPYGYMKDPDNCNRLIVDEEAAEVVRTVFNLFVAEGMGRVNIARYLNSRNIPNPSAYKEQKGIKRNSSHGSQNGIWRNYTVSYILQNEVYIGNLVQHKYHNVDYHAKHSTPCRKDEYIRAEGTHEPIIDMGTWDAAQRKIAGKFKPYTAKDNSGNVPPNLFSKKLYCKYCGYVMKTSINVKENKRSRYFRCATKYLSRDKCPKGPTVFYSTLSRYILDEIKKLTKEFLDVDNVESSLNLNRSIDKKLTATKNQIEIVEAQIKKTEKALARLYVDMASGENLTADFGFIVKEITDNKKELNEKLSTLKAEAESLEKQKEDNTSAREIIKKYAECEELTPAMVNAFIDRIYIGGTKSHRIIEIHWAF